MAIGASFTETVVPSGAPSTVIVTSAIRCSSLARSSRAASRVAVYLASVTALASSSRNARRIIAYAGTRRSSSVRERAKK